MRKALIPTFILVFICFVNKIHSQSQNDFDRFSMATFEEIFVKEFFTFKSILVPTDEILELRGQTLILTGYYIPVATKDNSIIISKTPFASCFFCGVGGLETVAEIRLKSEKIPSFKADQKITVSGQLQLNTEDWEGLSFILENAEFLSY